MKGEANKDIQSNLRTAVGETEENAILRVRLAALQEETVKALRPFATYIPLHLEDWKRVHDLYKRLTQK